MRSEGGLGRGAPSSGLGQGRLVPSVRNRPVGQETSAVVGRSDGGMQISVETALAFNDLGLRQSVVASYDALLRPEWCRVDATINSRPMRIAVDIGGHDAVVRVSSDSGDEERTIPVRGRPLLLVDNCFALHALAAWSVLGGASDERPGPGADLHTALPVGCELTATRPGLERIAVGGVDLGRPSVTLHLGPDLDEHAWFVDKRLERLAIPRLHLRVDRIAGRTLNGGMACMTT